MVMLTFRKEEDYCQSSKLVVRAAVDSSGEKSNDLRATFKYIKVKFLTI